MNQCHTCGRKLDQGVCVVYSCSQSGDRHLCGECSNVVDTLLSYLREAYNIHCARMADYVRERARTGE